MPTSSPDTPNARPYDIVLMGATGFTGRLTAGYLAAQLPEHTRWALAGRSADRLARVRAELVEQHPHLADLALVEADSHEPASLRALAESTRVVISTVGPYVLHGYDLVRACAEAGTDYVDLTGEPEFVDRCIVDLHDTARATGARIVNACGFDSIPVDLGTYVTAQALPDTAPVQIDAHITSRAKFSAGTFHSAVLAMARARQAREAHRARRAIEPRGTRTVTVVGGRPFRSTDTGRWAVPLPLIDVQVAARSARALATYGPDVTLRHLLSTKQVTTVAGLATGMAGLGLAVQVPALRERIMQRMSSGEGPDAATREKSWFRLTVHGRGGGRHVVTTVSGGDPGYTETSKMLAESAMCLAFDDNPATGGVLTTAQAMGDRLVERLRRAGITFDVTDA